MVVILGHVDSGKTSILDYIRQTHVAQKESGGITQHIGAYQIVYKEKKITFIDTPGHEAFSQMRSRGAKIADIAILVVDATKGVEPQTKEAISHIKKAEIPFIVALNKTDRQEADLEKTKRELMKEEVLVESLGGKVPSIGTSAVSGKGVDELLEMILLVAEMENLKADPSLPVAGWVLESRLDSRSGITVTLILDQGGLKVGDIIGTASAFGKLKSIKDFQGRPVEKAGPAEPILVFGFEQLPKVGEEFKSLADLESAKIFLSPVAPVKTGEAEVGPGQNVLNLIIKADYLGSLEAIEGVLKEIPQEKVVIRFLKMEVGDIGDSDIKLAKTSQAKILGFRVKTDHQARSLAQREKIKIVNFEIIYDLIEGVRRLMELKQAPEVSRVDLARVKILAVFSTEKNRQVIGAKVLEGEIKKGSQLEVFRGEVEEPLGRGKVVNLQKNKKDVSSLQKGEECGILYEGDLKIEVGDVLQAFNISYGRKTD